jgi:large subunit ribosomal protein L17
MKHRIKNRTLGRRTPVRSALFKNMTSSLLAHGFLVTTRAKARELKMHVEPLLRAGKDELSLHRRRLLLSKLARHEDLPVLIAAARAGAKRQSGWLRTTKLARRSGDGAELVRVEVIDQS